MPDLTKAIEAAQAAIDYAQSVRKLHRRRSPRGAGQREYDLKLARNRLSKAMKPIRSELGRLPFKAQADDSEAIRTKLHEVSRSLQAERRKIWKMQKRAA